MIIRTLLALVLSAVATVAPLLASDRISRVRPLDHEVDELLAAGMRQSSTLRQLVSDLECSDVIVHILVTPPDPRTTIGRLQFVTSSGGFRFVRIRISAGLPQQLGIALLGHELQHAREVAGAASIVDIESFETHYRRTGMHVGQHRSDRTYDTVAARETQRQVLAEILLFAEEADPSSTPAPARSVRPPAGDRR